MRPTQQQIDVAFSEDSVRNLLGEYGTIDGVIIDRQGIKAFAMFKYRDSALKVMSAKDENDSLKGYKLSLYSTSKAQEREEKQKKKYMIKDPIERLKAKILINQGAYSYTGGSYS